MNGKEEYINQYQNKINILLNKSKYENILRGFYYQISTGRIESEASRYNYLRIISQFLNNTNKKIEDITLDDYNMYKQSKINCKSSYQIVIHTALKEFSSYLYESDKSNKDYMYNSKCPKKKESQDTIEKRSKGYLTEDEIKILTQTTKRGVGSKRAKSFQNHWKERDYCIVMLFLNTGLRCSAIYKLDLDSIDFINKTLTTVEKGNKIRTINLSDQMIDCIKIWIKKRTELINNNENALFISNRRKRMKQESIAALISKYSINIEGKHITPHKLRATYATQIQNVVHDGELIQELMGHANRSTTDLYIREKKNRTKIGSDIMSKIVFN